jgi:hypothetical protein
MKQFVPLGVALADSGLPSDLLDTGDLNLSQDVGYTDYSFDAAGSRYSIELAARRGLKFKLPGVDAITFYVNPMLDTEGEVVEGFTVLDVELTIGELLEFTLKDVSLLAVFDPEILCPVVEHPTEAGHYVKDPDHTFKLELAADFVIDSSGRFYIANVTPSYTPGLVMVGGTGFMISVEELAVHLDSATEYAPAVTAELDDGWTGVHFTTAKLILPIGVIQSDSPPADSHAGLEIEITDCFIGKGGFTGKVLAGSADPSFGGTGLNLGGDFLGVAFEVDGISVEFRQSRLVGADIYGIVTLPFFDDACDVQLSFDTSGDFAIRLDADEGALLHIEQPDVMSIDITGLGIERTAEETCFMLSGSLQPLFWDQEWPIFTVKDLVITTDGKVRLPGGRLDLPEQLTLDLGGFQLYVSSIGFGRVEDAADQRYFLLSGGLRLVDGLEVGADFKGLQVTWDAGGLVGVTLDGITVTMEIENTLSFTGTVLMERTDDQIRFLGEIDVVLHCVDGLAMHAGLLVGRSGGESYLFIDLGIDLPTGIPIANTGVAIYGFQGLGGYQVAPNRTADEHWYEDWYKGSPLGVGVTKWDFKNDAFAVGAGVTVGTLADNGFTFTAKVVLVVAIPGPIVMLAGKANILKNRAALSDPSEEPIFDSLALFDGNTGELLFNLGAQYEIPQVLSIDGGAAAYFDLDNPVAWYFHLGEKPEEKRLSAEVLSIFRALAYFTIDSTAVEMGTWVGLDKTYSYGPVKIKLAAWIEGYGLLIYDPMYVEASLSIGGELSLKVFGFGFGFLLEAYLRVRAPEPWHLNASITVKLDLPWPLDDLSVDASLEWGSDGPAELPSSPLKAVGGTHPIVTAAWEMEGIDFTGTPPSSGPWSSTVPGSVANPVLPLDTLVALGFNRSIGSPTGNTIPAPQMSVETEKLGDNYFRQRLGTIHIYESTDGGTSWTQLADEDVFGNWAARVDDSDGPPTTQLLLGASSPFVLGGGNTADDYYETYTDTYSDPFCGDGDSAALRQLRYVQPDWQSGDVPDEKFRDDLVLHRAYEEIAMQFAAISIGIGALWRIVSGTHTAMSNSEKLLGLQLGAYYTLLTFPETVRNVTLYLQTNDELGIYAFRADSLVAGVWSGVGANLTVNLGTSELDQLVIYVARPTTTALPVLFGADWKSVREVLAESEQSEIRTHNEAVFQRWSTVQDIWQPGRQYQINFEINTYWDSDAASAESSYQTQSTPQQQYRYTTFFRTDDHFTFSNPTTSPSLSSGDSTGLTTLEPYYGRSFPDLNDPNAWTSSYVGVDFTVDYIAALANGNLTIRFQDPNGDFLTDADGNVVEVSNPIGDVPEEVLQTDDSWFAQTLDNASCMIDYSLVAQGETRLLTPEKIDFEPLTSYTMILYADGEARLWIPFVTGRYADFSALVESFPHASFQRVFPHRIEMSAYTASDPTRIDLAAGQLLDRLLADDFTGLFEDEFDVPERRAPEQLEIVAIGDAEILGLLILFPQPIEFDTGTFTLEFDQDGVRPTHTVWNSDRSKLFVFRLPDGSGALSTASTYLQAFDAGPTTISLAADFATLPGLASEHHGGTLTFDLLEVL